GANRRWRGQFRCRGSRRESAVAQLSTLGHFTRLWKTSNTNRPRQRQQDTLLVLALARFARHAEASTSAQPSSFWLALFSYLAVHLSSTTTHSYSFRLSVVSSAHLVWSAGCLARPRV